MQVPLNHRFTKEERVTGRNLVRNLHSGKNTFFQFPFRVKWIVHNGKVFSSCKILIIVPKRQFKKAVDRNVIKRRIREGYRQNKAPLIMFCAENQLNIVFSFTYIAKEILAFGQLQQKIILILQRLINENEKVTG